jgi:transcriptional regulator with XRE-family HTH domain
MTVSLYRLALKPVEGVIYKNMNERAPFITLGRHLKYVREQLQQSLEEVSGSVEIDEQSLERIEAGRERPSEDILLLLISHYGVEEQQALQLWELAEYDAAAPNQIKADIDLQTGNKVVMLLAVDMRTMYSDGLEIEANKAGVTLNFTQSTGKSQTMPVARVGMSTDQAEEVMRSIQQALLRAKYGTRKLLPPPSTESI